MVRTAQRDSLRLVRQNSRIREDIGERLYGHTQILAYGTRVAAVAVRGTRHGLSDRLNRVPPNSACC